MKKYGILILLALSISLFPGTDKTCMDMAMDCPMSVSFNKHQCETEGLQNLNKLNSICDMTAEESPRGDYALKKAPGSILIYPQIVRVTFLKIQNIQLNYYDNNHVLPRYFPEESIQFLS